MKLLLAFAAGVALTSLAFVLLDKSVTPSPPEQIDDAAPPSSSFPGPDREISPSGRTSTAADVASAVPSTDAVAIDANLPDDLTRFAVRNDRSGREAIDLLRSWSDEELRAVEERAQAVAARSKTQKVQEAESVLNVVSDELRRRELIASFDDAPPPHQPILLRPEFSRHLESANVRRLHERLQREPVDPTWSLLMERNLRNFIAAQSGLLGKYGSPTITCRTSACEITFVAYGLDTAARAVELGNPNMPPDVVLGADFWEASRAFREEAWVVDQIKPESFNPSIMTQDGITTVILNLWRDGG